MPLVRHSANTQGMAHVLAEATKEPVAAAGSYSIIWQLRPCYSLLRQLRRITACIASCGKLTSFLPAEVWHTLVHQLRELLSVLPAEAVIVLEVEWRLSDWF